METKRYSPGKKLNIGKCVVALGFFDGVHAAHRELIGYAKRLANDEGLPLCVFTFSSDSGIKRGAARIYDDETKLGLLDQLGVDCAVLADFGSIAGLSPKEFVNLVLIGDLDCEIAVAGFNFRFGKGASGDAETLSRLMEAGGRVAKTQKELTLGGKMVSATEIRSALSEGDIKRANELLSLPYFIKGKVAHGNAKGRTLGFPTVNMPLKAGLTVPRSGVYKTAVPIGENLYTSLTNVGNCPTLGARETHAETYIIDFDGDLYESEVRVYFLEYLRDEFTFPNAESLVKQINKDIEKVMKGSKPTWQEIGLS